MFGSFLSCHFQTEVFVVLVLTDSWNSGLKRGVDAYIQGGEARWPSPMCFRPHGLSLLSCSHCRRSGSAHIRLSDSADWLLGRWHHQHQPEQLHQQNLTSVSLSPSLLLSSATSSPSISTLMQLTSANQSLWSNLRPHWSLRLRARERCYLYFSRNRFHFPLVCVQLAMAVIVAHLQWVTCLSGDTLIHGLYSFLWVCLSPSCLGRDGNFETLGSCRWHGER